MEENRIIFLKLRDIYKYLENRSDCFLTYASEGFVSFTNEDFNFLNPEPGDELLKNENKMAFSILFDRLSKDPDNFYLDPGPSLSDSYAKILEANNVLFFDSPQTINDKVEYEDAFDLLYEDLRVETEEHKEFKKYREAYTKIDFEILQLKGEILNEPYNSELNIKLKDLEDEKNIIMSAWILRGHKEKIEEALRIISEHSAKQELITKWRNTKDNVNSILSKINTVSSDFEFFPTYCSPSHLYEYHRQWKKVVLDKEEIKELWEGDGQSPKKSNLSKIEFEYSFVSLLRPWFDIDVLNNRLWAFDDDTILSDGEDLKKGLLPAYLDSLIFVRRIEAFYDNISESVESLEETPVNFNLVNVVNFHNIKSVIDTRNFKPEFSVHNAIRYKPLDRKSERIITQKRVDSKSIELLRLPLSQKVPVKNLKMTENLPVGNIKSQHLKIDPRVIKARSPRLKTPVQNTPVPKTFNINMRFKEEFSKNDLPELNLRLINLDSGNSIMTTTDNNGSVVFEELIKGQYVLKIRDEEVYEDKDIPIRLDENFTKEIYLSKRAKPIVEIYLIGVVNKRVPKLPNPY